jgi:hypothetical protein
MNRITLQDIFNKAWQHFIIEDNPPATELMMGMHVCRYLTLDGRKCAVGLALPNNPEVQEQCCGFETLVVDYPDLFSEDLTGKSYLREFQNRLHDKLQRDGNWAYGKEQMKHSYLSVAEEYGLTVPSEPTKEDRCG